MTLEPLQLPLLNGILPGGIDYGTVLLVEFEPQSCWYDLSLTLGVEALRAAVKTDLHLFQRKPEQVKGMLTRSGLDVPALQQNDLLRILDSYTVQVGIGTPEPPKGDAFLTESVRIANWSDASKHQIIAGIPASEKGRFHLDENISVLARYNKEEEIVDYWRTRAIPRHKERQSIFVNAIALGATTEWFQRQFEAMADGVLDCRSREDGGQVVQEIRVRNLRGRSPDSRWHRVKMEQSMVHLDSPT
jgi:KaiC/GvpD/RAD55 family RecA-like ATPase